MSEYNIATKGGTMCFFGEWFGRPYDNFHKIIKANYENDCLNIYFDRGEILSVFNPLEIINEENCFQIKKASKVIWQCNSCGSENSTPIKYIYENCENGKILKMISGKEATFDPDEDVNIAVACLSY